MASMMNQSTQMEVPDTVTDPVANMSKHQLYQVLSQMKASCEQNLAFAFCDLYDFGLSI